MLLSLEHLNSFVLHQCNVTNAYSGNDFLKTVIYNISYVTIVFFHCDLLRVISAGTLLKGAILKNIIDHFMTITNNMNLVFMKTLNYFSLSVFNTLTSSNICLPVAFLHGRR